MNFRQTPREEPEINLVPMIDVLLMALIFLVLTTSFAREGQLKVKLPQASAQETAMPPSLQIVISADGDYAVNRVPVRGVAIPDLEAALQAAASGQHDPLLVVYADRKAPYEAVVHVMDAARRLGFLHLTFATRYSKSPPGPS